MRRARDPRQAPTLNDYTDQLQILDAVEDGITAQDPSGALVYANDAAARAMGFASAEELLSAPLPEVTSRFQLTDEDGHPLPVENLPGRLALQGMTGAETVVGFRDPATGERRFALVKARPVFDEDGKVRLAVNIFRDITDQRRAEAERQELLLRAEAARREAEASADNLWAIHKVTDVALSNLELDELLDELLERIREALEVDVAAISLVTRDQQALRLRAASGFDARGAADTLVAMGEGVSGVVASTRRPVTIEDLSESDWDAPHLANSGVTSLAAVPLTVEGRVLGVLHVGAFPRRSFHQREVGLLHVVGDRIAYAIDRARAFRAEHRALERSELAVERMSRLLGVTAALSRAATPSQVARVIIDEGLTAMGAHAGALALVAEDGAQLEIVESIGYPDQTVETWPRVSLDTDVPLARAIQTRDLVLVRSVEELQERYPQPFPPADGHASFAAIPLVNEDRALGALGLSFPDAADFSRVQQAFMRSLGQQCAQAIARARLYEAAQAARAEAEVARDRIAFLAQAGEMLGSSLDYQETLARVARLAVPRFGEWCVIETIEDDGSNQHLTIAHTDESKIELARELRHRYPPHPDAPTGMPAVLRSGRAEVYPEITAEMLEAASEDPEHLALLEALGFKSAMLVPLQARGRTFGVVTFASSEPRRYGPEDLLFAESLAKRAATAIDNARLFQETQESRERFEYLARTLQSSLLPQSVPAVPGVEVSVRYRAAAEGSQVGGDFYDLFEAQPGEWALVVGDVCGKGARAAALTGLARHTIRAVAPIDHRPASILGRLNDAIMSEGEDDRSPQFCTVAYASLRLQGDRAQIVVSSGGHPLPFLVRADGSVSKAGAPGLLLGVFADPEVTEQEVFLGPGDAVVFYTDGVTENRRDGETFGEKRLHDLLASCAGEDAESIAQTIERAVIDFNSGGQLDDIAILVLRVSPPS